MHVFNLMITFGESIPRPLILQHILHSIIRTQVRYNFVFDAYRYLDIFHKHHIIMKKDVPNYIVYAVETYL